MPLENLDDLDPRIGDGGVTQEEFRRLEAQVEAIIEKLRELIPLTLKLRKSNEKIDEALDRLEEERKENDLELARLMGTLEALLARKEVNVTQVQSDRDTNLAGGNQEVKGD